MKRSVFLIWKRAIFCQIKEIKHLSGGVVLYAAQTNVLVDAELVKKGRFRTETNYTPIILCICSTIVIGLKGFSK